MSIFKNLKQRKVFQWAVAYLAGAWLLMQLVDVLGARWGIPDRSARIIDIVLVVGFFITMVIAWYHGDQGRQRVSGPELLLIASLLAVGGLVLSLLETGSQGPVQNKEKEVLAGATDGATDEAPWIAVLPFEAQGGDPQLENFAAGLTEDIANGLSDFSYLLVLSRNTSLAAETVDVRQIGKELGARYVLQGALRSVETTTRITAQLVDTQNGIQIWAETFDRDLSRAGLLATQDELTDRIVASVADPAGVVVRALVTPSDKKAPEELTPYEAALRYFLFQQRLSSKDHLITRTALEKAVETEPAYADAWVSLSLIYQQEHMNNLNLQPNSLQRAMTAAQRAIDLDPTLSRAHFAMAQTHYFLKQIDSFQVHADRAIKLNPRNTDTLAMVGIMMGYSGDWERSVELTQRAMEMNPNHAGWYYFNSFFNEYRQRHYAEALAIAQKMNLPEYWASSMALAIAHAQLGHAAQARQAANELLRIWPGFEQEYYQLGLVNWIFEQAELVEHINQGLSKAGITLVIPENTQALPTSPDTHQE